MRALGLRPCLSAYMQNIFPPVASKLLNLALKHAAVHQCERLSPP